MNRNFTRLELWAHKTLVKWVAEQPCIFCLTCSSSSRWASASSRNTDTRSFTLMFLPTGLLARPAINKYHHIIKEGNKAFLFWSWHCAVYDCANGGIIIRADSSLGPSQWETALQSNAVSHWLGANLESALITSLRSYLLHGILQSTQFPHCSLTLVLNMYSIIINLVELASASLAY